MHNATRLSLFVILSLVGCESRPSLSNDAFQRAIRESRLQCSSVVTAEALNSSKTVWRVACTDAATYIARVERDGSLCVEPMPIGDFVVGGGNASRSACAR
jgi:hypothetical protein